MRISDWSSDVCSSDLVERRRDGAANAVAGQAALIAHELHGLVEGVLADAFLEFTAMRQQVLLRGSHHTQEVAHDLDGLQGQGHDVGRHVLRPLASLAHFVLERSEEHTSELQSLMRISYA